MVHVDDSKTLPLLSRLKVYPNPAANRLIAEFPKVLVMKTNNSGTKEYFSWKSVILEVYNWQGKMAYEQEIRKMQERLEMDVTNWTKGMYYFRLIFEKQTVGGVKVILE